MFGYIILGVVALIVALLAVCLIRTLLCKTPADAKLTLDQQETDRARKYAETLAELIRCETVSSRYDDDKSKFYEFHKVLERHFPNIHPFAKRPS